MSVLRTSNAPVGLGRGKPIGTKNASVAAPWVRPSDWVTFTTPSASEQKIIGNVAVWNQASNYVALAVTTSTGTYTVDWGDGTSTTHTSAATAEKNYVWGDISSGTLTSQGYRQAVITVTPTTGGATFSAVNLNRRHSGITSAADTASNPWLDIAIAAPNATTVALSYSSAGTRTGTMQLCERVNIVAHNTSNMSHLFRGLSKMVTFLIGSTASVTNMSNMFTDCNSLRDVPLFNTAAVTNMSSMFSICSSIQTVPLFNTGAVTSMSGMFSSCTALQTVPLFNTAAVTSMSSMFSGCASLQTVPLFNTGAVTNMGNMFANCASLREVPLFNTAAVTSMANMFSGCYLLQSIPLFNTAAVTSMNGFLQNCQSLKLIPLFNTAASTGFFATFDSCKSLQTIPLLNTAAAQDIRGMFGNCPSLHSIPDLSFASVSSATNNAPSLGNATAASAAANLGQAKFTGNRWTLTLQNCKLGAAQLDEMYTALATLNPAVTAVTGNGTTVTYTIADRRAFVAGRTVTITGVDPVAYNLTNVTIATVAAGAGNTGTFTVTNAATGTYVSGGVAAIQSDRLITVTGNPGTTGDDPTIATNKGWTVTG